MEEMIKKIKPEEGQKRTKELISRKIKRTHGAVIENIKEKH